jgi:hypothetical protein
MSLTKQLAHVSRTQKLYKKNMEFLGTNLSNYEDEQFENYKQN